MATVLQILQRKGSDIWSVSPGTSVYEALTLMREKNIGALLVLSKNKLAGIFSERDYARGTIQQRRSIQSATMEEVMTTMVVSVHPDQSIEECMNIMTEKRIRHLPVLDQDRLIGLISIGDVVKEIISDQQQTIEHLENYITGKR